MNIKSCIRSLRLRTIPLSLSGVVLGTFLSIGGSATSGWRLAFSIVFLFLTTVCLQILSNLSNDLGDYQNGTDTEERQGIRSTLQDGDLTPSDINKMIIGAGVLCCVFGVAMIWVSFGTLLSTVPLILLGLGALAMLAAVLYTLGPKPYGYQGLGDISVFIFFGLVSVCGASFVLCHSLDPLMLLPGAAIGLFSVGVLNINNIRDYNTDKGTRITMVIRLGIRRARIYHIILICGGWALMLAFTFITKHYAQLIYFITAPLFARHLSAVLSKEGAALDPFLPLLVKSTFAFALLAGIGNLL